MARNKYHAKKAVVNDVTFDSRLEARRYIELKNLQAIGEIFGLQRQPEFELQPEFKKRNKKYRKIVYIADFMYMDRKGNKIIEDCKGMETEVFRIKRKLFEYKYPDLTLTLIKR